MPTKFDHSDDRYLIVYATDEEGHNHADEIGLMFAEWVKRIDSTQSTGSRFGIMLVNHEDDDEQHDHDHVRDEEEENALTALAVQFRREHRAKTNAMTTGYASVYNGHDDDATYKIAQQRTAQFANYMFGVRGNMLRTQAEALAWLDEIADLEPLPLEKEEAASTTATTCIFYGSTTGNTEMIAKKVQAAWAQAHGETPPSVNVGNTVELMKLFSYDKLLVGIPTWNIGKLQDDWEIVLPHLDKVDLSGKQVALFGVGDQFGYPENFQDAMGILGRRLQSRGAQLVGYTNTAGYEHDHSIGVDGDQFMGLAIDDINQPELTDERIAGWVEQVAIAFAGELQAA